MVRTALFLASFCAMALALPVKAADDASTLSFGGLERTYVLRLPSRWAEGDGQGRHPLLIVLHGGGGSGPQVEKTTHLTELALKDGAIVVYPSGTGPFERMENLRTWNAGHCCGFAMKNEVDDIGFISALIDLLVREKRADPRRVYVTGISNGGMMTHRIGAALASKIAAIAPVVGGLFGDEPAPAQAVPALIINGEKDEMVPLAGGLGDGFQQAWDGTPLKPAEAQDSFWARANGCKVVPSPLFDSSGNAVWHHVCPAGREVVRYVLRGFGHGWPGGIQSRRRADSTASSFDASREIWAFFKAHAKP